MTKIGICSECKKSLPIRNGLQNLCYDCVQKIIKEPGCDPEIIEAEKRRVRLEEMDKKNGVQRFG